jgi:NAD(P)-dependent dehydrogenase (short-subunit alcohol dehydrogenase family)
MDKRFVNKIATITGAANGIGRATAMLMAREGAAVVIADVDQKGAEDVAELIRREGGEALALQADVMKPREVDRMVDRIVRAQKTVHILINNVGGSTVIKSPDRRFEDLRFDEWESTMIFNLRGTFLCTRALLPWMKAQRYGRIVNLSSILARGDLEIGNAGYAAAKAAIQTMTRRMALEFGPFGITCNAVAPGITLTERIRKLRKARPGHRFKMTAEDIPLKRLATPEEQARVIAFLASDDAAYVSGQTIEVTGGR